MTIDIRPPQKEIVDILTRDNITKEDVKILQEKLGKLSVDGDFGPKTAARTMEYLNVDPMLTINLSEAAVNLLEKSGQGEAYKALQEQFETNFPISSHSPQSEPSPKEYAELNGYGPSQEKGELATAFSEVNGTPNHSPTGPAPTLAIA